MTAELYVAGSVSTLLLPNLGMSFTFYVVTIAFGALIGAFGSLFAGLSDRFGRANLVVFGLLFAGVFVAFIMPAATSKWPFTIESFVVSFVEGMCLVATPALIRDFSPQVGRATAMGFWTSGPVVGSLIVAVVATATIPAVVTNPQFWTHEYHIAGIAGLVMFVIAFIGLKELSPQLRDQLMVTMRDRALIEARAKGMSDADIEAALRHPFRQLIKPDVIVSSIAVSIMLLIYYTAVLASVIYLTTVFGFSLKNANGLGNWNWGFNVIAVILVGFISDRFRVRKPFIVIGGVLAAVMTVIYLEQAGHHEALRLAASTGQVRLIRLLDTPTAHAAGLTAREIDVLRLISRGRSNRDIAAELRITENTAANHVRSILIKTGAANRTQVAMMAVSRRWVDHHAPESTP